MREYRVRFLLSRVQGWYIEGLVRAANGDEAVCKAKAFLSERYPRWADMLNFSEAIG